MDLEYHPFGHFIPQNVQYLVVGTFPGRLFSQRTAEENQADIHAFSYGGRNQFCGLWNRYMTFNCLTEALRSYCFNTSTSVYWI